MGKCKYPELKGYSGADWGGDTCDRKSVSGRVIRLCGSTVAWKSMKQTAVALSTTEAEYIALAETVREIIWLRRILLKLGFPQTAPTIVKEDNQACISWVIGDAFSKRSLS